MTMPQGYKQKVLETLRILQDEPDAGSDLFQFGKFADQIANLLADPITHTPFAVALHGEWGSGKTSLMKKSYELLKQKTTGRNVKTIWFDAWEYERLDPTSSLLTTIANEYSDKNTRFKEVIKGLVYVFSDIALRANIGLTLDEFTRYFESTNKEIITITSELEKMIGDSRLIVFVDDLDRCLVDNALNILEAIKLFLNAKGVMFVVAVDMKKLERAWHLRHGGLKEAELEGKEHVEKIFQLKLSLPPKEEEDLKAYVAILASSLSNMERDLIVGGCPSNPRKIKRIMNLLYFLTASAEENTFDKQLPIMIIWSIITSVYPELAKIISRQPKSLVQMALASLGRSFEDLRRSRIEIENVIINKSPLELAGTRISHDQVFPSTIDGLLFIIDKNPEALTLLHAIVKYYSMPQTQNKWDLLKAQLDKFYAEIGDNLIQIIFRSSLIG